MSHKEKKAETLCNNNLSVKETFTRLRAKLKKLGVKDQEIYDLINDGRETLRVMKLQGQHMENRLRLYHDTLSKLSFVRVRRGEKVIKTKIQ